MVRIELNKEYSAKEPIECWYDAEDFYFFAYFTKKRASQPLWRVSRHNLTFNVTSENQLLQSIDAYSPCSNWHIEHNLNFPKLSSSSYDLRIVASFDSNGIGIIKNKDAMIQYQVSDSKRILRLIFEEKTDFLVAIAPNVVAGISNNDALSELWFDFVQYRNYD